MHSQGQLVRVLAEVPPGTPTLLEAAGGVFDPEKPRACNPGAAGAPAQPSHWWRSAEEDPTERRTVLLAGAHLPPTRGPHSSHSMCVCRSVCRCVWLRDQPLLGLLSSHVTLSWPRAFSSPPPPRPCPSPALLSSVLGPEGWVRPLPPASVQHLDRLPPEMSSDFLSRRAAFRVQLLHLCHLPRNVL